MRLATGTSNGIVTVWNATTGSLEKTFQEFQGLVDGICVQFCPDGQWLACNGDDNEIWVWNVESGRKRVLPAVSIGEVEMTPSSPEAGRLTQGVGPISNVWDLVSSADRRHKGDGRVSRVAPVGGRWSPDGRRFVTMADDHLVRVWDASTARCIHTLAGHSRPAVASGWSPDGTRIATGGFDGKLIIWDSATGKITLTLQGKDFRLFGVRWSPDGKAIATVGSHRTITIWDASRAYERE